MNEKILIANKILKSHLIDDENFQVAINKNAAIVSVCKTIKKREVNPINGKIV